MGEESNNSSLAENMEIKDFELPPAVKDEISSVSCLEMDVLAVGIKEEVRSDLSYELNESSPDCMNNSLPQEGQGCLNDSVTPFCFVRIKMEEPDESDMLFESSEKTSFTQEYPSNPEEDCNTVGSGLDEKSSVKPNSPSSNIEIKREREESIECGKSGSQINDGISDSEDVNSELDSNSVVNRCDDLGHSSHEFIRGIECQQFPILWPKQEEEKTEAQYVVKRNKTASNTCGSSRMGKKCIEQGRGITTSCGLNQESLNYTLHDGEISSKSKCDVQPTSISRDYEVLVQSKSLFEDRVRSSVTLEDSLRKQTQTHTEERRFTCVTCQATFGLRSTLKQHMQRLHSEGKPFTCVTCEASFRDKRNLANHARTHTGVKPFSCVVCGVSFGVKSSLIQHMRTHTGEKPFTCDTCNASFRDKRDLVKHTRSHTGEKPFSCVTCKAGFSRNSTLAKHRRIHTGEKPFVCGTCGTAFTQKSHMVKHSRIHTGEKRFTCVVCKVPFSDKRNLLKHTRTHTEVSLSVEVL